MSRWRNPVSTAEYTRTYGPLKLFLEWNISLGRGIPEYLENSVQLPDMKGTGNSIVTVGEYCSSPFAPNKAVQSISQCSEHGTCGCSISSTKYPACNSPRIPLRLVPGSQVAELKSLYSLFLEEQLWRWSVTRPMATPPPQRRLTGPESLRCVHRRSSLLSRGQALKKRCGA